MKNSVILLYGVLCYVLFIATFLYAIGFVAGVAVPKTIDDGPVTTPMLALVIDLLLLGLFAVQHSGVARRGFKRWLTAFLPQALERSTYVLLSSLALILLFWLWRPLPGVVWSVDAPIGQAALYTLSALGWLIVFTGTFMINHFDLFGLRQVWLRVRGRKYTDLRFRTTLFYKIVRHPLMLGFLIAFWATPTMTTAHLLFACATTGYILLALRLEERDLVAALGQPYRDYRRSVPMLLPWPRSHAPAKPGLAPTRMRKG